MDFHSMKRRQLQDLCKKHNLPANKTNLQMAESLASILKAEEKPVESSGEIASVNGSGIVVKRSKKVRFCLEEKKIEIVDLENDPDDRLVKKTRRKSILKPQLETPKLNVEEMGNSEDHEEERDIPIRGTRSCVRKSMGPEEPVNVRAPPLKRKKSRTNNESIENVCRNDKAPTGSSLLGDGVAENSVVLENAVPMRRSLRRREIDVYPERKDMCSTKTRRKSDEKLRDGDKENIVPMTRNLRRRKLDVYPEKMDTNLPKTRRGVSDERKKVEEVEELGVRAKKSVKKRSMKMQNGDVVEKRKIRSDETKICVIGEEETEDALETGDALKQMNRNSSSTAASNQSSTNTELVAGVKIQEKFESLIQFGELITGSGHKNKSGALVSNGEYGVKVEGNKRKSKPQQPQRRSQRRALKSKSFAPETENKSESIIQIEEENEQVLQIDEPTNSNAPRLESSALVTKDEAVVQSERKMVTKSKNYPRRSRRKAHENKSIFVKDDSGGRNKAGEKLEEPLVEEDISLPEALIVEDEVEHRPDKAEDIVYDEENSGSLHSQFRNLVNADVRKQSCESHCDEVVLMEEKESAVTMVENSSLLSVSDRDEEMMNHAVPLVEELIDEDGGEDASMLLKESQESAATSEVSEDHDICSSDTTLIKSEDYASSELEDETTTEVNFATESDIGFVEARDMGNQERFVEEHDDLKCGASPVHGHAHADSDECALKDDKLLDDEAVTVTEAVFTCESGRDIACDEGNARKSQHFSLVETNDNDVESEKQILSFDESVKQLVFLEEAGEEVPEMIHRRRMDIQQSDHQEKTQYSEISVNQHPVQIDCCVTDRDVEDYKGFVSEGGFVEHEEADGLFKSFGEPAFDHLEARGEDGDSNEIRGVLQPHGNAVSTNVAEDIDIRTQIDDETIDICQVDPGANERTGNVLDKYGEEHQVNLQVTDDKIIVEGEEFMKTIEDKFMNSEQGKQEKDALEAELKKEGDGETAAVMDKESEFPGPNDISEDCHGGGIKLLVSQGHYPFNEENLMNDVSNEEDSVHENMKGLAEEGKDSGSFQLIVPLELVDMEDTAPLRHGIVNAVSNELIVEENRSLEDKAAKNEILDCMGGKCASDGGDNAMISPQIELTEPLNHEDEIEEKIHDSYPDCISIEQYNTMDNGSNKEISSSQHTEPRYSWLNVEDHNGFNYKGDLAEWEDTDGSVHTIDEPSLDHLELPQKNEVTYEICDVHEYDGSGIFKNTSGVRDVDDIECKEEINDASQVIPQANETTTVNEAERYLVHQAVKEVQNDTEVSMEYIATMEEECLHKDSEHQNKKENTKRCIAKLENISQVPQKSEESSKAILSEHEDDMEEDRCRVGRVDYTDPEHEDKKGNMVEHDPEPDGPAEEISALQQTHEIVQAELLTINSTGLHSPLETLASSRSAGRNLDGHYVLISSASILSRRESQEVSREAVNDLEDVEHASGAEVTIHSVNRNFDFEDILENVQLMETFELESLGKFSEDKGKDHVVGENEDAMEQNSESKCTELTAEGKLEVKASGAAGVKANVEACLLNFDVDDDVQAASVMPKNCSESSESRNTIKDVDNHGSSILEPKSPSMSHADGLTNAEDAENENASPQIYPLELADHEGYDGKVHDAKSVAATLEEPASEYDEITENNSNGTVEGNFAFMDPTTVVLEKKISPSLREISSTTHDLLGSDEVLMKANLVESVCRDYDASENLGDNEENAYTLQIFPENHGSNEDHIMEQVSRGNDCDDAVLDDDICDHSRNEKKKREADVEDSTKNKNFSESSLRSIKASGSFVKTLLYREEKDTSPVCYNNKRSELQFGDNCRSAGGMRNPSLSSIDIAEDRGDNLELEGCNNSNADFPHLLVDQAEDKEVGNNDVLNANSEDQENDDIATSLRSPISVEKAESCGQIPDSIGKEEMKEGTMDDINILLRKFHISSAVKWRGFRTSTTPRAFKKSREDLKHNQLAFDMKENIMSMKCDKSGNCLEKQSASKRRALKDLQG